MDIVSIVVPVYNIEEYIEQCIESLLSQTYSMIQIILIDDGSTDRSGEICDAYARKDGRITNLHQENKGVSAARNYGLDSVKGGYVMFVDGDDVIPVDSVEILVQALNKENAKCAIGLPISFEHDTPRLETDYDTLRVSTIDSTEAICDMLYERRVHGGPFPKLYVFSSVEDVRFPDQVKYAEDLQYNYYAMKAAGTIALVDRPVYYYRLRPGSAMGEVFSRSRLDGLVALRAIVDDALGSDLLEDAAVSRYFMEAVYIGMSINRRKLFDDEFNACTEVVRAYARKVCINTSVKIKHRIFAAVAWASPNLLFTIISTKGTLKKFIKKGVGR